ncbi:MAG: DUF4142 domain-containing protein [Lautropia sp.]|nr:DUF4142 domain-containing protein [Lautropia sp.]
MRLTAKPTTITLQIRLAALVASGTLLAMVAPTAQASSDSHQAQGGMLLAQAAPPAGTTGASATTREKVRNPDRGFAEDAATGSMAEIESGKRAQAQASAAPVKSFASQMVTDHTMASDQLKQLATSKGITLPGSPDRAHARQLEKLGKMQGAEFDREYMKMMVADHKKTVSLFEKEAKRGKDPELKNFAAKLLPDLQKHLQMAQSIEGDLKKTATGTDAKRPAMMK